MRWKVKRIFIYHSSDWTEIEGGWEPFAVESGLGGVGNWVWVRCYFEKVE